MPNKVKMTLIGVDGNAFFLMGAFSREARKQGWTDDEITAVTDECMKGDYDHLLRTLMDNIDDCGDEDDDYDDSDYDCDDEAE
jgi:hypothetical protein